MISRRKRGGPEISGRERLLQMGPVFTSQDLRFRTGWSKAAVQVALSRWRLRDGFIQPLAGRSEVYFNLVVAPDWHAHFEAALKLAVPHAYTIGQSVYVARAWTNQASHARHLAVPAKVQLYPIEGCQFHVRRRAWFLAVSPGVEFKEHSVPELRPAWALADALFARASYERGTIEAPQLNPVKRPRGSAHKEEGLRLWAPDPDELYVDDVDARDLKDFTAAVENLKRLYGFPRLSLPDSCITMRLAYATTYTHLIGAPTREVSVEPGTLNP